jgi:hypothetical protein
MLPTITCIVIAIIAVYASYSYYTGKVEGSFDIAQLKYDLHSKTFGQTEALNAIINNLAMGPHYNHAGVVFLIGGTGVGKTLALSLVRENYKPSEMIITLLQQDLSSVSSMDNAMEQVKKLASVSGVGLVTIDNADVLSTGLWDFVNRLNEFCVQNRIRVKVLIASQIFQDVNSSDKNLISNAFKNSDEYVNHMKKKYSNVCAGYAMCMAVLFKPIGIETLEMCINSAAKALNGKALTKERVATFVEQISESGLDYVPGGCKSVESHVGLFHEHNF